jgi:hypothetical protein
LERQGLARAIGGALFLLCLVQAAAAVELPLLAQLRESGLFRVGSGIALAALVAHQWLLYFARRRGSSASKTLLRSHLVLGVSAPALLMVHAPGPGYGFLAVLWSLLVFDLGLGMVPQRALVAARWLRSLWLTGHIAVSVVVPVLIAYHVWVVVYYE